MNRNNFVGMGHNPNPNVPDLPEGFAMALLQEDDARTHYEGLNDIQKTDVIKYIQSNNVTGDDARNKIDNAIEKLRTNNLSFISFK